MSEKGEIWKELQIKLYALLGEAHETHQKPVGIGSLRIVRIQTDGRDLHVSSSEAFFPSAKETVSSRTDVRFVKPTVYDVGRSEPTKRLAASFLRHAGVRPFDAKALVERMLADYTNGLLPQSRKSHLGDVRRFVDFWKESGGNIDMFNGHTFLYDDTFPNDETKPCEAGKLYIDIPYLQTGLRDLFDDDSLVIERRKRRISNEYQGIKQFLEFALALGVMRQLEIASFKATKMQKEYFPKTGRNTSSTADIDYFINGLHWRRDSSPFYLGMFSIDGNSLSLSKAIWAAMCNADPKVLMAYYVPNDSHAHERKSKSSFLVDYLAENLWVPDQDGHFHRPKDVSKESLHPHFAFDDRNGWLTATGFGAEERKRSTEYAQENRLAQSMGFDDAEHMDLARKAVKGRSKDELMRMAREHESSAREEFPERPSADPERRRQNLVERRENAPAREKVQRERSIEPGIAGIKAEAKAYLRGAYTNGNGKLICQCCRDPMPFKLPATDQDYFEAVLFIKGLKQQFYENYLALCPTCSAKYQHACLTDDEEIKNRLMATDPDGQIPIEIEVTLVGKPATLRFVGTHALDLKIVLK